MRIELKDFPDPEGEGQGWPWVVKAMAVSATMADGKPWPKISIVTPNYNYAQYLEETIRSVLLQGYPNLEYIIMDGGSTDNSVEIIKKYESWITYWENEKDRGQAHAINKGLERATGSLVNWVNSDDVMLPGSLRALAEAHQNYPNSLIAGDVIFHNEYGEKSRLHHQNLSFETIADPRMKTRWMQPGIFVPTSLLSEGSELDENLRYQFDRDWMLKLSLKAPIVSINQPLLIFRVHSEQRSLENLEEFFREGFAVMERYADYTQGVSVKRVRSYCELALAGLFLGAHPHYASYWSRVDGLKSLGVAFTLSPRVFFDKCYLQLLRRSMLPKLIFRSKVDVT